MANPAPEVSVTTPVSQAYDRVKEMLFRPFDLGRWFVIGFTAWLAFLGEGGGFNGNFGNFGGDGRSHHRGADLQQQLHHGRDFVLGNLYWIVPLAVIVFLIFLAVWAVMIWLNSRGKFMFLHCVALNRAEVEAPWREFKAQANSLFWFRIVLGMGGSILMLPALGVAFLAGFTMVSHGGPNAGDVLLLICTGMVFLIVMILFLLVEKFTTDFVVPLMFLRRNTCWAAWKEFYGLLSANVGRFIIYLLFQFVLGMVIGMLVLVVILLTCCIAGCLMALPYVGTVLILPILIFQRAYPLHYLAQFGPAYNIFPPPARPFPPMP